MRTIILVMINVFLLASCATANKLDAEKLVGLSSDSLQSSWGRPDKITPLANGNTRYTYIKTISRPFPSATVTPGVLVAGKTTISYATESRDPEEYTIHCVTTFELSKHLKVLKSGQKGYGCN